MHKGQGWVQLLVGVELEDGFANSFLTEFGQRLPGDGLHIPAIVGARPQFGGGIDTDGATLRMQHAVLLGEAAFWALPQAWDVESGVHKKRLQFQAVCGGFDDGGGWVFAFGIGVGIADVFEHQALAHDGVFQLAEAEDVLGDGFAFVLHLVRFGLEQRFFVLFHALEEVVRVFAELFGGGDEFSFVHAVVGVGVVELA